MANTTANIHFIQDNNWEYLQKQIKSTTGKIYVLLDENTMEHCYPILLKQVPELKKAELIEIEPGEESKSIQIAAYIWETLTEQNAGRDALFINVGGGVVCDLGGFVASVYKRGISFTHIPSSLLAMVDAAIGGKTGLDFMGYKNQLGTFSSPDQVLVWSGFLSSLEEKEMVSGYAEVLKHALISHAELWNRLKDMQFENIQWEEVIPLAAKIKSQIVEQDPLEKGKRELLNFGHTIGHGIETFFLNSKRVIRHGEAVAAGMLCETYLSHKLLGLSIDEMESVFSHIAQQFPKLFFEKEDIPQVLQNMRQDKKNVGNQFRFVLLKKIGLAEWNVAVEDELVRESLLFYVQKYGS